MRISATLFLGLVCLSLSHWALGSAPVARMESKQLASSGMLSALSSMMPGVLSNVLPLVLMFGLGALLVPTLGLASLFRESKRRSLNTFHLDTAPLIHSVQEVFEKFINAIDKMEQKYN